MNNYNVLVFPCGTEIANEVINSLEHHKYFKMLFASSEGISFCNFRKQNIDVLPYVGSEKFELELKKLIEMRKIDFIIPAHDDVAYELSKIEDVINCKVIGQNQEINNIVRFKDRTYEYFNDILPIATIFSTIPKNRDFPVFVKPIRGQGALNAVALENIKEFEGFFKQYSLDEFIVMEKLTGKEFTIDCFSDQGKVLYSGVRSREQTTKGISVLSTFISNSDLNDELRKYADVISKQLTMHGIWFFQMKFDKNNELKLLEIGPRVPGSMMLNRARGVNFVELALYQALGFKVEVTYNDIEISMGRSLVPKYIHNINFETLYIDFDDTLLIDEKYINSQLFKIIFDVKNLSKEVVLITKNKKNNLSKTLHKFGIIHIFDDIIHLNDNDLKVDFMKEKSLLVDDSFLERKLAIQNGHYAFGLDNLEVIL